MENKIFLLLNEFGRGPIRVRADKINSYEYANGVDSGSFVDLAHDEDEMAHVKEAPEEIDALLKSCGYEIVTINVSDAQKDSSTLTGDKK